MKRIAALALALAALSSPAAAEAQAVPDYLKLMTVDAVAVSSYRIRVTGVVQGEASPTTREFLAEAVTDATMRQATMEQCHRMLMLALSKPGQYLASVSIGRCEVALVKP